VPNLALLLALALVAGLAGGVLVDARLALLESLTLSAAWSLALLAYRRMWPRVQLASLVTALLCAGWVLGEHAVDRALHTPLRALLDRRFGGFAIGEATEGHPEDPLVVEGVLAGDAAVADVGVTLHIRVDRVWIDGAPHSVRGGISVGVGGSLHGPHIREWTAGRRIRAPARLGRPARFLNHGLPDQERALARRGVTLVGAIKSAALVEVVARGPWWDEAAAGARARTRAALDRHVRPRGDQTVAIATAILIGDRDELDVEVEQRLQQAGTYHVIAISGGNIAILAGLLLATLGWAGVRGPWAWLVTIAALALYALVAAGGPSVARATLMAALYLAVRLIDHRTSPANAIGLTGAAVLLHDPIAIADVGFWLTFGATAAILTGMPRSLAAAFSPARAIAAVMVASCCVELALAPLSVFVFQRVTLAGLVLNLAALPAMTVVQIGAMLVVFADVVGLAAAAGWCGHLVHAGCVVLTESATLLDYAPWLTWRVPAPALATFSAYYGLLAAAVFLPVAGVAPMARRVAWCATLTVFVWILVSPPTLARVSGDGRLHVTLFDVGQGDAACIVFPNGRRLVVDAGGGASGEFDVGARVIAPALLHRHITRIDYLAVTHGDPDHLGGAHALVREFSPAEVWSGVPVPPHEPTQRLRAAADRARATWRTLWRGDRFEIGAVEVRVHHPPPPEWERQRVRNDDSLVLELRYGDVSVLLTGDIGREVEEQLLASLELLPMVALKVAHHGSATSTSEAFVKRARPRIALIGVGRGNTYGHPVPAVLTRLTRVETTIFRTDRDGQIDVVTDGRSLSVDSFSGRRLPE
jgi:competence protein ComEC